MIGVELRDADIIDVVLERLKDDGFLLGKTGPGRNVLTLMPPLVISAEELDSAAEAIERALCEVCPV
jgi:4-aminobutyrate aminotransferase-like enzyme